MSAVRRGAVLLALLLAGTAAASDDWPATLTERLRAIDAATTGALGAHIVDLADGRTASDDAERRWYLASTIKVPVAIAVLQSVEAGELSLDDTLVLQQSDFVDGAGDLVWQEPGGRYSIRTLLEKSLVDSDSTATDMLIRRIGEDTLNRRVQQWVPQGFGRITTILQVRYDAYGLMHPGVAELSNMDLIRLKVAAPGRPRRDALLRALGVAADALAIPTIEAAFAAYYRGGSNSATLVGYGRLLERLARGELLSAAHTELVLDLMQRITTGERRIQAGLPDGARFAQKTGTQLQRACNVGLLLPERGDDADAPVVVAACIEDFGALSDAETAFRQIGAALAAAGLAD